MLRKSIADSSDCRGALPPPACLSRGSGGKTSQETAPLRGRSCQGTQPTRDTAKAETSVTTNPAGQSTCACGSAGGKRSEDASRCNPSLERTALQPLVSAQFEKLHLAIPFRLDPLRSLGAGDDRLGPLALLQTSRPL